MAPPQARFLRSNMPTAYTKNEQMFQNTSFPFKQLTLKKLKKASFILTYYFVNFSQNIYSLKPDKYNSA